MKTLSNMLLMLALSAPLFANTITPPPPPPPPEKLSRDNNLHDFSRINQTTTSTVSTADTLLITAEAASTTTPESTEEEPEMLPPLTVEGDAQSTQPWLSGDAEKAYRVEDANVGVLGNKLLQGHPLQR